MRMCSYSAKCGTRYNSFIRVQLYWSALLLILLHESNVTHILHDEYEDYSYSPVKICKNRGVESTFCNQNLTNL